METLNVKTPTGKLVQMLIIDGPEELAQVGADVICETIKGIDEPAISFAGGSSPVPVYEELVRRVEQKVISFKKVRAFLLDEWFDLPPANENTFRKFINDILFERVDLPTDRIHYFEGRVEDHMRTCFEFEKAIQSVGGMDLQILGIGSNAHIAFNEPGTPVDSRTRLIKLRDSTRLAYADYFDSLSSVPQHALSQGLANILESRRIVLFALGSRKDEAIYRSLKEPACSEVPASHLQNFEGRMTFVVDSAAARRLL